jgi:hypothetical protein
MVYELHFNFVHEGEKYPVFYTQCSGHQEVMETITNWMSSIAGPSVSYEIAIHALG